MPPCKKSQFQIERELEGWVFYKNAGTWEEDIIFLNCIYEFKNGARNIVAGAPPLDFASIDDFLVADEAYEKDGRKLPEYYKAVYFKRKKPEPEQKQEPINPDLQKLFMMFKQEFPE